MYEIFLMDDLGFIWQVCYDKTSVMRQDGAYTPNFLLLFHKNTQNFLQFFKKNTPNFLQNGLCIPINLYLCGVNQYQSENVLPQLSSIFEGVAFAQR